MIRALTNKLQERAYGGPSPSMKRRLNTLVGAFENGSLSFNPGVVLKAAHSEVPCRLKRKCPLRPVKVRLTRVSGGNR
jgi:hypothetical protein